jgi:hypothetical protein
LVDSVLLSGITCVVLPAWYYLRGITCVVLPAWYYLRGITCVVLPAARLKPGEQKAESEDGEDDIVEPEGLRRLGDHNEGCGDGDGHDDLDQRAGPHW